MKACEAAKLTKDNLVDQEEMEKCLSSIRGFARQGKFETYFTDLKPSTKEELKKLGYSVESFFSRNESNDTISWEGK